MVSDKWTTQRERRETKLAKHEAREHIDIREYRSQPDERKESQSCKGGKIVKTDQKLKRSRGTSYVGSTISGVDEEEDEERMIIMMMIACK